MRTRLTERTPMIKIRRPTAWLFIIVFGFLGFRSIYCQVAGTSASTMNTISKGSRPDPNRDLPPVYDSTFSGIEMWLNANEYPWKKEILDAGKRKLICVDFTPYSGLPAHHLFVYQQLQHSVRLLFCSIVWNPPKQGASLSYMYNAAADSLSISTGETQCLSVRLSTLWCE